MTITKNHNGSITVSTLKDSYLFTRTYYGYSEREAVSKFRQEIKEKERV